MENQNVNMQNNENWENHERSRVRGKIAGGFLIVCIGLLFLARELGVYIPGWIFSWQVFLIALGVVIGIKHNFRKPSWFILMLIGSAFLISDFFPTIGFRPFLWPILIILIGFFIILKSFKKNNSPFGEDNCRRDSKCNYSGESMNDDFIKSNVVMGGVKKNILSKNFKGGEIANIFGGTEINLSQADFEKTATIEIKNVFGGTKLVVPANWKIHSEIDTIMGGVEDKRPPQSLMGADINKVLVLKGSLIFGGIEIVSY